MLTHHINILFIVSLCFIGSYTNQLLSADHFHKLPLIPVSGELLIPVHSVLFHADHNQHIFEHGSEGGNEELRCTCKTLNAAGALYRSRRVGLFNEKYQGVDFVKEGSSNLTIPSVIIFPGGKQCSVLKYDINYQETVRLLFDLSEFFEKEFVVTKPKFNHGIIADLQRKY